MRILYNGVDNAGIFIKMDFSDVEEKVSELTAEIKKASFGSDKFYQIVQRLIESKIELSGSTWCMDVRSERRKMAKLITKTLMELRSGQNAPPRLRKE